MKVSFQIFGGDGWLGGLHYLSTLLSALHEHAADDVEAVLLAGPEVDPSLVERLRPHLSRPPVPMPVAGGPGATICDLVRRRARRVEDACLREGVDVAFQHAEWLGSGFGLPTLAWLGDFQHKVLPEMFSRRLAWRREARFRAVLRSATLLYVLSDADRQLGAAYYPNAAAKLRALTFAVGLPQEAFALDPASAAQARGLPERYVLFPGQLWRHKNHLAVIEAVARLKARGTAVTVVFCGNPVDHRDSGHAPAVRNRLREVGLGDQVQLLGLLPRPEVWALARRSIAVLNPSLYEGWSTPVEEAKSLGAPVLLSDLPVHREQRPAMATFFNPRDPDSIAEALETAWRDLPPGPRHVEERRAADELEVRRIEFAARFVALAKEVAGQVPEGPLSNKPHSERSSQ